jgi:hypothetical protein
MITFKCQCEKVIKVAPSYAGKRCRCPGCGEIIRVPGGQPRRAPKEPETPAAAPVRVVEPAPEMAPMRARPKLRAEPTKARPLLPLIAGALMLATLFIPWMAGDAAREQSSSGRAVVMSWDMLHGAPVVIVLFMVMTWVLGAGVVVVSSVLRDMALSISHAVIGFFALVFAAIAFFTIMDEAFRFARGFGLDSGMWRIVLAILSLAFRYMAMVVGHIRLRIGERLPVRISQIAVGIGLTALVAFNLVMMLVGLGDGADVDGVIVEVILFTAAGLLVLGGGILTLVHGAVSGMTRSLSDTALTLLYLGTALHVGYFLFGPAIRAEMPGIVLMMINVSIAFLAPVFIMCHGLVNSVSGAVERLEPAAE